MVIAVTLEHRNCIYSKEQWNSLSAECSVISKFSVKPLALSSFTTLLVLIELHYWFAWGEKKGFVPILRDCDYTKFEMYIPSAPTACRYKKPRSRGRTSARPIFRQIAVTRCVLYWNCITATTTLQYQPYITLCMKIFYYNWLLNTDQSERILYEQTNLDIN